MDVFITKPIQQGEHMISQRYRFTRLPTFTITGLAYGIDFID